MASQAWQPEQTNPAVSQAGRRIRKCHVSKEIISIFSPGREKAERQVNSWGRVLGDRPAYGPSTGAWPPPPAPLQTPRNDSNRLAEFIAAKDKWISQFIKGGRGESLLIICDPPLVSAFPTRQGHNFPLALPACSGSHASLQGPTSMRSRP
jgi:hypothetical protein